MSADNGIYILETSDKEYRIAHLQGKGCVLEEDLTPKNIVELWKNCHFTSDKKKAYEIAYDMANSQPFCEYGVQLIKYDGTWYDITEKARKEIKPKGITEKIISKLFPESYPIE